MKFYKIIVFLYISFVAIGCESVPKSMHSFSTTLNEGIKTLNTTLNNGSSNSTALRKTKSPKGMLTSDQCQSTQGKTKSEIEIMANEKLTDRRAYSLNSFVVTYNFQISDRLSMYGVNSDSKAICSLTFDGNHPSSKVLSWSVIG
ncbi:hypothetical protein Q5M49_02535 [Acinetobacter nosocomialis]|uniref:hypothetical protein n=1 Tax=Acinetobacter nosocomialis TaxID=106654 RepID=UPI0026F2EF87|nr:hypothetical protein [Acinetobacter nosocomialis]MDO7192566.1 hypothetical protein [Acinetobacter nosocomialis]MDO7214303.1 hypothetical protein [Acinetobacter nosocomialis]MDX7934831.1 hypothetical protein [Acinetobacter baumannii]